MLEGDRRTTIPNSGFRLLFQSAHRLTDMSALFAGGNWIVLCYADDQLFQILTHIQTRLNELW
jgi:hypothetical protein